MKLLIPENLPQHLWGTPKTKLPWRTCLFCGQRFVVTREDRMTCSKPCTTRVWIRNNPDKVAGARRRHNLKKKFTLTVKEWDKMFEEQKGRCALCRKKNPSSDGRRLAVDHDHKRKVVRGLLCGNCNKGLGNFKEDPELLIAAIDYLQEHS